MIVTYLIFLILAIVFKIMHFPGMSFILLFSALFPFIDMVIQLVRKKENKETRILSSIAFFFLSIFITFRFLHWPGYSILFWIALFSSSIYIFQFFSKRINYNVRFIILIILSVFSIFNFSIKKSNFRMLYLLEDPFNPADNVAHFYIQCLAYEFYLEGDYDKAEKLIERNINHIKDLINEDNVPKYMSIIDEVNLEISKNDLGMIQNRSWNKFTPLNRLDRIID